MVDLTLPMELSDNLLQLLKAQLANAIAETKGRAELESLRRDWLGKEGTLKQLFAALKSVEPAQKAHFAATINQLKTDLEQFIQQQEHQLDADALAGKIAAEYIDLSLPPVSPGLGREHPITSVEKRITEVLRPFGFESVYGPEVETDYYCFDSLNIAKHHPARDLQDTFYTQDLEISSNTLLRHVLRTHTTSVQARTLAKGGLPVRVASFGRTYRNETEDASHQAMFHQYELVWIEKGLTLANLQGIITHILKALYGKRRKVRFVPKYYPYTEPSVGPQIDCSICKGGGCSACGGSGWVTVAGAGMVHRNVLLEFKYNPEEVSGFAFGLGTSRLASQFYNLPKLKDCYANDLRVLTNL